MLKNITIINSSMSLYYMLPSSLPSSGKAPLPGRIGRIGIDGGRETPLGTNLILSLIQDLLDCVFLLSHSLLLIAFSNDLFVGQC